MIKDGVMDGVDEIYGIHVLWPDFKEGEIHVMPGN